MSLKELVSFILKKKLIYFGIFVFLFLLFIPLQFYRSLFAPAFRVFSASREYKIVELHPSQIQYLNDLAAKNITGIAGSGDSEFYSYSLFSGRFNICYPEENFRKRLVLSFSRKHEADNLRRRFEMLEQESFYSFLGAVDFIAVVNRLNHHAAAERIIEYLPMDEQGKKYSLPQNSFGSLLLSMQKNPFTTFNQKDLRVLKELLSKMTEEPGDINLLGQIGLKEDFVKRVEHSELSSLVKSEALEILEHQLQLQVQWRHNSFDVIRLTDYWVNKQNFRSIYYAFIAALASLLSLTGLWGMLSDYISKNRNI